jgi:hypothetical protein
MGTFYILSLAFYSMEMLLGLEEELVKPLFECLSVFSCVIFQQ